MFIVLLLRRDLSEHCILESLVGDLRFSFFQFFISTPEFVKLIRSDLDTAVLRFGKFFDRISFKLIILRERSGLGLHESLCAHELISELIEVFILSRKFTFSQDSFDAG